MNYLEFLNENNELENLLSLIKNKDSSNVQLGLILAVNYEKDFIRHFNCSIKDYTILYNWLEDNNIKRSNNITNRIVLSCENSSIYELPDQITAIKFLNDLNLSNNKFQEIPEILFDFKELQYLNLCNNKLCSIPTDFGNLKNTLKFLDVSKNNITNIPEIIGEFKKLKTLILDKSLADSIPNSIKSNKKIKIQWV